MRWGVEDVPKARGLYLAPEKQSSQFNSGGMLVSARGHLEQAAAFLWELQREVFGRDMRS